MYCQKCNRLLSDDNLKCSKCGFDNSLVSKSNKLKETEFKNDNKLKPSTIIIGIIILVVLSYILTVIIINSTKKEEYEFNNTVTEKVELTNTLTFKGIKISYPDTWGSSKTTVFNRESPKINITFKEIVETEYNELTKINECLKHSFQGFDALTYASDSSYSYIFSLDGIYYKITVNYENSNSYNDTIQNEISNIIDSIKK